jgi:hypothetical protein
MIPETTELDGWMREVFPVRAGNVEMVYVAESAKLAEDRFVIVMQLFVYTAENQVRDIKEQELHFSSKQDAEPKERVEALVRAWAAVLGQVLADIGDDADTLMPHDLAPGDAIRLARSRSREQFEQALRAKGRLGRFLKS